MLRLTAIFIALCMVLLAAAVGAVLHLAFGLSVAEAAIVAIAVLTALALYNTVASRLRDRSDVGDQIADIARAHADVARQLSELDRRLAAVETRATAAADQALAAAEPLAAELGDLGDRVRRMAQSVAMHEELLAGRQPAGAATPREEVAAGAVGTAATSAQAEPVAPVDAPAADAGGSFRGMEQRAIVAIINAAINADRVEPYLQPIVTLPQRKVRYYEALARLKVADGAVIPAGEFLAHAESGGLIAALDNRMAFRCVQVVRRLLLKNRDIGLFCNISATTLVSAEFQQFLEFMEANRALGPSLAFEFTQAAFRAMGPVEHENLAALAARGFRFSLDHLEDLRLDPRDLAGRGFRFIKAPAALLLNRARAAAGDVRSADLSDLLVRFGIDLIAEKIESEGEVVNLLDCDVRFGQGLLFSPPRPLRAEALPGQGERNELAVRAGDSAAEGDDQGAIARRARGAGSRG